MAKRANDADQVAEIPPMEGEGQAKETEQDTEQMLIHSPESPTEVIEGSATTAEIVLPDLRQLLMKTIDFQEKLMDLNLKWIEVTQNSSDKIEKSYRKELAIEKKYFKARLTSNKKYYRKRLEIEKEYYEKMLAIERKAHEDTVQSMQVGVVMAFARMEQRLWRVWLRRQRGGSRRRRLGVRTA